MDGKLIDLTARELLEKFGAGNHKPGSGSASAYQGMLSAQMLRTVIDLTNEPKRQSAYDSSLPELLRIKQAIESRIYIDLENLFQQDSEQFDKVIILRESRDKEQDPLKKRQLTDEALEDLKAATEIPFNIAELCVELGNFAIYVFDNGFRAARGDSGVALNSAVSAIAGCLSIIELNLSSLPFDDWMERVVQRKTSLRANYDKLVSSAVERLEVLEKQSEENIAFHKSIASFQQGNLADSIRSNSDIEKLVRDLQNTLWLQRHHIFKSQTHKHPIEVLKPEAVLKKVLNYSYLESETLGMYAMDDGLFEIAGLIDKTKRVVQISKSFAKETQNFTAAHELAHAILHRDLVLHRDKPIDGPSNTPKNREEMQADKFAAYFLMPAKSVKEIFQEIFEMPRFVINENTVLALGVGSIGVLRQKCQNLRGLARELASAEYYAGKSFNSLAKIFSVSVETMAIRLEELNLLEF